MFVSAFALTGCGEEEEEVQTQDRIGTTLTLWLPAAEGSEVDDEAVINVENAINEFTQKNYTTAIKLKVFPAKDYDSIVLSKLYEIKAATDAAAAAEAAARKAKRDAKKNASTTAGTSDETEAETTETEKMIEIETTNPEDYILPDDADGKKVYDYEYEHAYLNASLFTTYPAVETDQFDIFLVHGYEEFNLLNGDFLLSDLTPSLKSAPSKTMKSYINNAFLNGVQQGGLTYLIPNNRPAGEISAMLINKRVCEELYYDPAEFTSVEKLFTYDDSGISFIEDVMKAKPDIIPVAGNYTASNIKYFNSDDDNSFSIIAALVSSDVDAGSFGLGNVFANTNFVNAYKLEKRIEDIVKPAAFDPDKEFAVGFFKGTYEELEQFEDDYQIVNLQKPQLSTEELYASCFAVSSFTKNVDRAMEIITAINCNTELRTILQYGQEGVHWRYDVEDENVIHIMSDKYKMDLKETGNVFITYPGDGRPISDWEGAKASNVDLYLPYTIGFDYKTEDTEPLLKELTAKSEEIYKRIEAMSSEDFNSNLNALKAEVNKLDCFQKLSYTVGVDPELDKSGKMNLVESIPYLLSVYAADVRGW